MRSKVRPPIAKPVVEPPNYRDGDTCGSCVYRKSTRGRDYDRHHCKKHDYEVEFDMYCDDYKGRYA